MIIIEFEYFEHCILPLDFEPVATAVLEEERLKEDCEGKMECEMEGDNHF